MKEHDSGDWQLEIALHWPHQRLALGWEIINPDEQFDYQTIRIYLLILTVTLDF